MRLIHEYTAKNPNGVFEVGVIIVNNLKARTYTYQINSERVVDNFTWMYKRKWYGKALNELRKGGLKRE